MEEKEKDKAPSYVRATLAVIVPVAALAAIGAGVAYLAPWAIVVGALVWLDFWGARVGSLVRLLKFGQLMKKWETTE